MTEPREAEVALGLGSNVGDKCANIRRALSAMEAAGLAEKLVASSLYETPPWGPVEQDWYVNACAVGSTTLAPLELLNRIKALEIALGRVETLRWGPRVIDVDILYYGDLVLDTPRLKLPHPQLLNRAFVLIPLAELRPEASIGGIGVAEAALASQKGGIRKLGGPPT